ncbi:MAG TPA: L-lactate permease [Mycobacteriales bacterium]|nr:L-lactate permease [Mycobacteriales bacterium]
MGVVPVTPWSWLFAVAPVLLLFGTVVRGRVSARMGAVVALGAALICATTAYGVTLTGAAVGVGKGLWLGFWILLVVWPALLLYRIVAAVGFARIGDALSGMLPGRTERLLVVAWLFPSFVQGVAGFGTPIAVAAPLLLAMGWNRVRAVALPLVGYHWSVTFGSMGSSFYVASLTAGFGPARQGQLALHAAVFLALNCLVAGALVLVMDGGWRRLVEGLPLLVRLGLPTAATLVVVAMVVPAVASLVAGTVGLGVLWLTGPRRHRRARVVAYAAGGTSAAAVGLSGPGPGGAPTVPTVATAATPPAAPSGPAPPLLLCPYLFLLLTALPVFLVPWSRSWVRTHLLVGPHFPATRTGLGFAVPATDAFNPVALVGHPGGYILFACALGYLAYRRGGLLGGSQLRGIVATWARGLPAVSVVIVCLTSVAMVMSDSGMVSVLARGTEAGTGHAFPVLSPVLGALGSFMTGSTASSNTLLAAFQGQVGTLLGLDPTVLVAAQTAGANVGNSLAPVVILIGLAAVGAPGELPAVLRRCLLPAAVLLAVLVAAVLVTLLA